jgi:WD40 repeat protein
MKPNTFYFINLACCLLFIITWVYGQIDIHSPPNQTKASKDVIVNRNDLSNQKMNSSFETVINFGHTESINSLVISPSNKYAASSAKNKIIVWDLQTSKQILSTEKIGFVSKMKFIDNSNIIISTYNRGLVSWNIQENKETQISDKNLPIQDFALSKDKNKVFSINFGGPSYLLAMKKGYEMTDEKSQMEKSINISDTTNLQEALTQSIVNGMVNSYNATLATTQGYNIQISNIKDKKTESLKVNFEPTSHPLYRESFISLALSLDEKKLIIGTDFGKILIWDIENKKINKIITGHSKEVNKIVCTNQYIITASSDKSIRLWNNQTFDLAQTFLEHTEPIYTLLITENQKHLYSAGKDGAIKKWDLTSISTKSVYTYKDEVLGYSADIGHLVLTSSSRFLFFTYNAAPWDFRNSFIQTDDALRALGISAKNTYLYGFKMLDLNTNSIKRIFKGNISNILKSKLSMSNNYLVLSSGDKYIKSLNLLQPDLKRNRLAFEFNATHIFPADSKDIFYVFKSPNYSLNAFNPRIDQDEYIFDLKSSSFFKANLRKFGEDFSRMNKVLKVYKGPLNMLQTEGAGHVNYISKDGSYLLSKSDRKLSFQKINGQNNYSEIKNINTDSETLTAIALSYDNKYGVTSDGQTASLWDMNSGNKLKNFSVHKARINDVDITNNNKIVITSSDDNTVKFWSLENGNEICNMILGAEESNDFVIFTPDNYYFGSSGGVRNMISFVRDKKNYDFYQFDLQYNRPDIVLERIGLAPKELIESYKKAYEKRLKRLNFNPENFEKERSFNVPEIKLTNVKDYFIQSPTKQFKFAIEAIDQKFKLDRLNLYVNGVPVYGIRGKDLKSKDTSYIIDNQEIMLSQGENIIDILVVNQDRVKSFTERLEVEYIPTQATKPNLYMIGIGASKYKSIETLPNVDNDIRDFVKLYKTKEGSLFNKIIVDTLLNESVEKNKVLQLRNKLKLSQPDDIVIVYYSGHGAWVDTTNYYLATYDINSTFLKSSNPQKKGLLIDDIESSLLDSIPARKKLFIVNACKSGETDKDILTFEKMKELFIDLRINTGTVIISSTQGNYSSRTSGNKKNSEFGETLLDMLNTKFNQVDKNKDKEISIIEFKDYLEQEVSFGEGGRIKPTIRSENIVANFRIW